MTEFLYIRNPQNLLERDAIVDSSHTGSDFTANESDIVSDNEGVVHN